MRVVCDKGRSFTLFPDRTIEFEHPEMHRLVVLESEMQRYDFQPAISDCGRYAYGPGPEVPKASLELALLDPLDRSVRHLWFEVLRLEPAEAA